jgi:predicted anti-sigma-YlaC factor YlaD
MKDHSSQSIHSGLTCRDITDRVSEYLDDCVPLLTKIRVGLHLASCSDCRTYVRHTLLVRDTLTCLPKPSPSPVNRLRLHRYFSLLHSSPS